MGNRRLDVQGLFVECLQLLVVLLHGVHLDLQRIDLQQLGAFLQVVLSLFRLTRLMQLLEDLLQFRKVVPVKVQLAELRVRLEPQPVVLCIPQRIQSSLVEVLQ